MRQAVRKKQTKPFAEQLSLRLREAGFIVFIAIALLLLLALATYNPGDPGWSFTGTNTVVQNKGGQVGAWFADIFLTLFGFLAYFFPILVAYTGWLFFKETDAQIEEKAALSTVMKVTGSLMVVFAGTGLSSLHLVQLAVPFPVSSGGIIGDLVSFALIKAFNPVGASLLMFALVLTGVTLLTGLSWLRVIDAIGAATIYGFGRLQEGVIQIKDVLLIRVQALLEKRKITDTDVPAPKPKKRPRKRNAETEAEPEKAVASENKINIRKLTAQSAFKTKKAFNKDSELPALALLDAPTKTKHAKMSDAHLEDLSRQVELKLKDFGVDAEVVEILPGPVVTRFELQLAPGIKASKVSNLAKDLARSLLVTSVRVVEVIPGKSVIGLELPNPDRETVRLREVLESDVYFEASSVLTMALGKDIAGFPVAVNLAKMPHLLVAGTTGSGKSVGLNAMLLSLLYKATPEHVRLILIDPKMLELSIYEGIPHLLTPVVTDMSEASNALRWCVAEMEYRYQLMARLGVRNITGYNKKVTKAKEANDPIANPLRETQEGEEPEYLEPLPYIVVVIDELADMMMVVGKKVEQLIARIAQKARAAGIHLILATQRPSVDVITGLIKANIPTRIAFQVSSRIDSRTILDQQGAEHLLGHGDMLYLPPGSGLPVRVHGAFVDDHEVHKVVQAWRQQGEPDYLEGVLEGTDSTMSAGISAVVDSFEGDSENDPLYDEAVFIVTKTRRASISSVQRRLKIGYNRAARIIEDMEKAGIVSEMQTNGTREVLAPPPPE